MKPRLISVAVVLVSISLFGQQPPEIPFQVTVAAASNQPAPALQSFAYAVDGSRWLLVGGRTNGFHRTSTREATFPTAQSNEDLYVVDVAANRAWKAPIPSGYLQQLRSTNMEYYQDVDKVLYLIGGYGSICDDDKPECYQTFPNLTAIDVPKMINAIIEGRQKDLPSYIITTADNRMKVTGGELFKLGGNFYLVFGQDFEGIYKGGISGNYTDAVRRFKITINITTRTISISDYQEFKAPGGVDSQYHRRDLNVAEAIRATTGLPFGLTAFGGVFTKTAGAWTNPVYIDQSSAGSTTIRVDTSFNQKMSQYTCGRIAMFSSQTLRMYTTFLGGISLYYYDKNGNLVASNLDNFMPFINTITTLARLPDGNTVEWPQPPSLALPELIGANAVFIRNPDIPLIQNSHEVIDYDKLPPGPTLVGYLYGGIHAMAPQISFINPSYANSTIYGVYVRKTSAAEKPVASEAKPK